MTHKDTQTKLKDQIEQVYITAQELFDAYQFTHKGHGRIIELNQDFSVEWIFDLVRIWSKDHVLFVVSKERSKVYDIQLQGEYTDRELHLLLDVVGELAHKLLDKWQGKINSAMEERNERVVKALYKKYTKGSKKTKLK